MKILMFSSDRGAEGRMRKYGEAVEKLEIVYFDRKRGRFVRFWRGYGEAKRILRQEKFDLITAQEIEHSFLAWRLSRKFGVPWQMQIHTDIFSPHYSGHRMSNIFRVWFAKFLIPRASCIRVVSQRIKNSLTWRFHRQVVVLPIYSDIQHFTSDLSIRSKYPGYDFYILMVARLTREKNIPLALEAIGEFAKKYPKTLLVIVGEGSERKSIESRIRNQELGDNVKLDGWQENLSGYYLTSDILLLTSDYEGYGMAALEALEAGLPVIMSDVGVAGEVVKDGLNGLIFPVGDKERLLRAFFKIREDENFRKKLSGAARQTPRPYQSFEEYRDKLVNSWKTCVIK